MHKLNRREFLGGLAGASAVHDRAATRPGRPRLSRAERHDPARPGRLRHAGPAPGQHRHRPQRGLAVRRGRRSESRQLELPGLESERQPQDDPPVPRRAHMEPGRHRRPRRPRGRERIMEIYYRKQNRPSPGIRSYEDYREMLEKETDIQGIVNITPDHQHASINISAMREGQSGDRAQAARAHASSEVRRTLDVSARRKRSRTCSPTATRRIATRSPRGSTRARSATSAKCTTGRTARSGRKDGRSTTRPVHPCPPASTGSSGRARNRIGSITRTTRSRSTAGGTRTVSAVSATWGSTACGSRTASSSSGRRSSSKPGRTTTPMSSPTSITKGGRVSQVGLPKASTLRWRHPATADRPAVDTFWYDGGMKPQTPEELYTDNQDLADEGMLFIGDKGKILCDFRAARPRLIPESRQRAFEGSIPRRNSTRRRQKKNG